MKNNRLECKELWLSRDGISLLPPQSFTLEGGDLLAVQGKNGCGKTTLLRTLADLNKLAHGEILWNGVPLRDHTPKPLYIGHKRGLNASLTVRDNIRVWAHASGAAELYAAALHYFDLEDLEDATVSTLSAGWQQRVALARLIVMPSALWLLDEPTNNLDAEGIGLLHSLLETRLEQGGIAIVASHNEIQGKRVKSFNFNDLLSNNKVLH